jgi:peptidoglycan/LPS O-acetylase OafA/YrhL
MLGYFVFSNDEVIERLKKIALPLIVAAVVICVAFAALYFGDNYADKPINRGFLYALDAYVGSLAMLAGMARFGDSSSSFTKWMSAHSFGLYVFHYLGISSVALLIAKPGLLPAPACYILSLVAGGVFGYGLYAIISRIPFFRWAVLGIKKEK